jgi:poly(glycerol-phosphate) alpha-glucosyltransferase
MLERWALRNSELKKSAAAFLFERANLQGASCIHCSAQEAGNVRAYGLKNPIAIIPNGVDLPSKSERRPRPAWLPDDNRRTLLFLGRLHAKKGVREVLDAWHHLSRCSPDVTACWRLAVVGWDDGGYGKYLVEHVRSLSIPNVLFPGPAFGHGKDAILSHADAFVLASHSEGLPLAVLEACAHGLPVFITRECNVPEVFETGAGIEIQRDPIALANVLGVKLRATDLNIVGERGRALVASQFSWFNIGDDLLSVYEWLTRGGPLPSCVDLHTPLVSGSM